MSRRGGDGAATMLGWHFLAANRRMAYGKRGLVEAGRTYHTVGPLKLCQNGLHASRRAIDALKYAPGPVVCRVRLVGEHLDDTDKSVARTRTVLWMADASTMLHEFALVCAHNALGYRDAVHGDVDPRSWAVLEVKARWLRGEASNTELAGAAGVAWAAGAAEAAGAARAAWAAGVAWAAGAAEAAGAAGAAGVAWAAWAAGVAWAARAAEAAGVAWAAGAAEAAEAVGVQNLVLELMLESLR